MASSFLSRWSGRGEQEGMSAERASSPDPLPVGRWGPPSVNWSASPSLEKLAREFEEQLKAIEAARRYLEDRVAPFQRHLAVQQKNADQSLKQMEARLRPLRQYLEGQELNLNRVSQHLTADLREQLDSFGQYLSEQKQILEKATQYLDEQPRPIQRYTEDQQRIVELIYQEIEEKLEPFSRFLQEQQRLLETIATPQILQEFETLANFVQEREGAFERYALSSEHRPANFLAELDEIHGKYKAAQNGTDRLLQKILEQTRLADDRLREALRPAPPPLAEARPGDEPRAEG